MSERHSMYFNFMVLVAYVSQLHMLFCSLFCGYDSEYYVEIESLGASSNHIKSENARVNLVLCYLDKCRPETIWLMLY